MNVDHGNIQQKDFSLDLKTVLRKSKLKKNISKTNEKQTNEQKKENIKKINSVAFEHKKRFLECKNEILQKSRISPLWNDDLELLFKIKPHRECYNKLKSSHFGIKNPELLVE